jgi:2-methylcitrate dehydratase
MDGQTVVQRFAGVIDTVVYDAMPPGVVHEAKRIVLDTLRCALAARDAAPCRAVVSMVSEMGGNPQATVIGYGGARTSSALATLANGTMMRFLDANDYYIARDPAHASGNLAVALAVGEQCNASGRDVITALVRGYEIQHRLCECAGKPSLWDRGWHHATNVQFASAGVAAALFRLDPEATANALAIAGTHNNTLTESVRGKIATIKATLEATTAKAGVEAALLARHGIAGPATIFEGRFGWGRIVAGEMDTAGLLQPLAGSYKIMDTCMKRYSAHGLSQGLIHAAIDLGRRLRVDIPAIQSIEALLPEAVLNLPAIDQAKMAPVNRETADHSPAYLLAVGLLEGECGPGQFSDARLASEEIRALISRVSLRAEPRFDALWPGAMVGGVAITMRDGKRHESLCYCPPGHPSNRLADTYLEAGFIDSATPVLGTARARHAVEQIWELDRLENVGALMSLLA